MTKLPPYVSLCTAVRIVAAEFLDGEELVGFLSDNWIKGQGIRFDPDPANYHPDNIAYVIKLYGPRWKTIGPDVMVIYKGATEVIDGCRLNLCWNLPEAVSSGLTLSDHAARSMI